jgi:hypothetical protein
MASDLFAYLGDQAGQGALDSEGEFTLAQQTALKKLAGFQLPSPGDWIVKCVQAIVASGSDHQISVRQTRRETQIAFTPGRSWTGEEILFSFYHPQHNVAQDMQHLRSALWALTLGQNRAVRLTPASGSQSLIWDGQHWSAGSSAKQALLVVDHFASTAQADGRKSRRSGAATANSFASVALITRCFLCPLPLSLDNRRIDALQNCPRHGWRPACAPLYVGAFPANLPTLRLPPGTWKWSRPNADHENPAGPGLEPREPPPDPIGIAFLVSYHYSGVVLDSSRPLAVRSTCNWVLDGAVIAQEPFDLPESCCALGVWLSAEGLPSDLSGFGLIDTPERRERLAVAAHVLAQSLDPKATTSFAVPLQAAQEGSLGSGILMGTGAILLALLPMAFPLGGTVLGVGWLLSRNATKKRQQMIDNITAGLAELSQNWCARYDRRALSSG